MSGEKENPNPYVAEIDPVEDKSPIFNLNSQEQFYQLNDSDTWVGSCKLLFGLDKGIAYDAYCVSPEKNQEIVRVVAAWRVPSILIQTPAILAILDDEQARLSKAAQRPKHPRYMPLTLALIKLEMIRRFLIEVIFKTKKGQESCSKEQLNEYAHCERWFTTALDVLVENLQNQFQQIFEEGGKTLARRQTVEEMIRELEDYSLEILNVLEKCIIRLLALHRRVDGNAGLLLTPRKSVPYTQIKTTEEMVKYLVVQSAWYYKHLADSIDLQKGNSSRSVASTTHNIRNVVDKVIPDILLQKGVRHHMIPSVALTICENILDLDHDPKPRGAGRRF